MQHRLSGSPQLHAYVGSGTRMRWLTELHPADLRRYERAVAAVVPAIERRLGAGVFANRTARQGELLPIGPARRAWDAALARAVQTSPGAAAAIGDVHRCYASIGPPAVDRALALAGVSAGERRRVVSFLGELARAGLRGLPIGPEPSAVLANCVLAVADEAAVSAGASVLRWVDDVVVLAVDPGVAARAFDAWSGALGDLGLKPNDAKVRRVRAIGDADGFAPRASPARAEPMA